MLGAHPTFWQVRCRPKGAGQHSPRPLACNTASVAWTLPTAGRFEAELRWNPRKGKSVAIRSSLAPSRSTPRPFRPSRILDNAQLHTAFDDPRRDGAAGQPCSVVDPELLHEMLPVFLDCFHADAQFRCDLFVGLTLGGQLEHFRLAGAKLDAPVVAGCHPVQWFPATGLQAPGNRGTAIRMALVDLPHRSCQDLGRGLSEGLAPSGRGVRGAWVLPAARMVQAVGLSWFMAVGLPH